MSDTATAAKIAWLEAKNAELHEKYQSLLASVQRACEGTGCLNAWELRQALDASRLTFLHNQSKRKPASTEGQNGHR